MLFAGRVLGGPFDDEVGSMTATSVSLILLGEPITLQADEVGPAVSAYTGSWLRRIRLTLVAESPEEQERLQAELDAARGDTAPIMDINGDRWRVLGDHCSHPAGLPLRYVHTVELASGEELSLVSVEFDDVRLVPERWSLDDQSGNSAMLVLLTTVDTEGHRQLEASLERHRGTGPDVYFLARWLGIKDTPVRMRFGRCLWQPLANGDTRHLVTLVTEDDDEPAVPPLNEPERSRAEDLALHTATRLDALITELHRAGALDGAAVGRIRDAAPDPHPIDRRYFDRADNLDEHFDWMTRG